MEEELITNEEINKELDNCIRDSFALEAMKIFTQAQVRPQMTIINRIKFWFGSENFKCTHTYNFDVIARSAYEIADHMMKTRTDSLSKKQVSNQ